MGIFGNIFQNKPTEQASEFPWITLDSVEQLAEIENAPETELIGIFKHSTRCGISKMVLRQVEAIPILQEEKIKLYFLDLLKYRPLSQEIASRFQVVHESPQLILLQNNKVVYHASHHGILNISFERLLL